MDADKTNITEQELERDIMRKMGEMAYFAAIDAGANTNDEACAMVDTAIGVEQ